jgi:hypothetical protein
VRQRECARDVVGNSTGKKHIQRASDPPFFDELRGQTVAERQPNASPPDVSTGELVSRLSQQMSVLVRDEIRLAQLDLTEKGKRAGIGVGAFGGAGAVAYLGVGTLIAAAVLGLAEAVPGWLSALIVGIVLLAAAGGLALFGKKKVESATPPFPAEAVEGLKQDLETVKEHRR